MAMSAVVAVLRMARAVRATIVAAVPAVQHAEVAVSCRAVVVTARVVVAVSADMVPGMTAAIAGIEHRTSEVEVVAVRIAGIDAEVPVAPVPIQRTVEIRGVNESLPLPVQQNIAHVQVAALPICAVHVVVARHTHQVVEVDFVGCLVLCVSQVQLVGHLVRQEQSLVPCLLVAHCLARCCYRQQCYQGHHHLLHIHLIFLLFNNRFLNFSPATVRTFLNNKKGFLLQIS